MDVRNISAAQDVSSPVAWLFLLTITSGSNPPLRLCNNNEEIVSRGNTYLPYPFKLVLPEDTGDRLPVVQLQIDNIAGDIIKAVREFATPPNISVEMVTSAYPDIVEKSLDYMTLRSVNYDSMVIQGTLEVVNILTRKFPAEDYNPVAFPGLFY